MPPTAKELEVRMRLVSDGKAASSAVKSLKSDVNQLNEATKDANKSLALSAPQTGGASGTYGVRPSTPNGPPPPNQSRYRAIEDQAAAEAAKNARARAVDSVLNTGVDHSEKKRAADDRGQSNPNDPAKKASGSLLQLAGAAAAAVYAIAEIAKASSGFSKDIHMGKSPTTAFNNFLKNLPIVGGIQSAIESTVIGAMHGKNLAELSFRERSNRRESGMISAFGQTDQLEVQRKTIERETDNRQKFAVADGPSRMANRAQYGERFEDSFNQAEFEANKARREIKIASRNEGESNDAATKQARVVSEATKQLDQAKKAVKNAPDASSEAVARAEVNAAESRLVRELNILKATTEAHGKASNEYVQKLKESQAAETALIAAKRDRAKTLLDESKTAAAAFAASTDEDKYMLAAASKQLQEGGANSLAPEQKQLLLGNAMTAEKTKRELLKSIQDDPMLNSILKDNGKGTLAEQEKEVQKLNAEIDAKIRLDEGQYEEAFRKALQEQGLDAEQIARRLAQSATRELDNRLEQNNLGQALGVR